MNSNTAIIDIAEEQEQLAPVDMDEIARKQYQALNEENKEKVNLYIEKLKRSEPCKG